MGKAAPGVLALALACTSVWAQDEPVFKTEVKVVNVLATVRDKNGRIIHDLDKSEFTLTETGRPQTIQYFAQDSDLPLTLGLLIDTSMSQVKVLDEERRACYRFVDQVLREKKDHVFVMQFDMGVYLRQKLTSSRAKLDEVLPTIDSPTRRELEAQRGGGTLLYDALVKASGEIMQQQGGRKALILLTDGVDTGSESTLPMAIEAAQRADTIIYTILYSDSGYYSVPFLGAPDGKGVLMRMSKETGGAFFEVTKKHPLEQAFSVLEEELRSQYSLGYVSDKPVELSEWRKIQLAVSRKGLIVQARERYWAKRSPSQ